MEYRRLGRTGLLVSPLCLGTMNFGMSTREGVVTEEAEARKIMDRAIELGLNFWDTANVYGGSVTEEIIGRWFAQDAARRDRVVIATKVFGGSDPWPNSRGLSAYHIRKACEDSLRRMQTDHIDLYQMHHVDRNTPWDEIWQAMEQLVREGKVIYVGSSNFAGWHIAAAQESARQRNFLGLVSEQSLYNLNARSIELEVLPACEHYGLGVIPWSPLGGGLLGGVLEKAEQGRRASGRIAKQVETHRPKLEAYEAFCKELGERPAEVGLAWLLANPTVTAPIIGPRTLEQLETSMRAIDFALDEDALSKLDSIFPGPGGAAPEAYAW